MGPGMNLRNIAIIAHVDHGKTTLVDRLLQQSGAYRENQRVVERAMDSNDLERERGITILAKATSVVWQGTRINIVDTPGHADFGGEVERILNMVDGALVLVDAAEGPLPQTKFVVSKALKMGLKPIVVINKVDRSDARPTQVVNEVFDLFAALDASEEQLEFPILYGSAKQGWMADSPDGPQDDGMAPLFDLVLRHVKPPQVEDGPFRLLGTILEANPYLGRIVTGRITSGSVAPNQSVKVLDHTGKLIEQGRVTKVLAFRGLERTAVDSAEAGDIVAHRRPAGRHRRAHHLRSVGRDADPGAADRSADPGDDVPRQRLAARRHRGRQGDRPHDPRPAAARGRRQRRAARARIRRQGFDGSRRPRRTAARHPDRDHAARGLRALGVAAEGAAARRCDVRRTARADRGGRHRLDEEHSGIVVQKMSERKAELVEMRPSGGGRQRLVFYAPTRGLIGYQGELLTDTRGTAIMNRLFHAYAPFKGAIQGRRNGVLISNDAGEAVAYALWNLEDRGPMMIEPGWKVYRGMIVGEHTRDNDLVVNVLKGKKLTNIRTTSKDEAVRLTPPIRMTLEKALAYIQDDELVEVTPKSIRLRKKLLDETRAQARRAAQGNRAGLTPRCGLTVI